MLNSSFLFSQYDEYDHIDLEIKALETLDYRDVACFKSSSGRNGYYLGRFCHKEGIHLGCVSPMGGTGPMS